MIFLVFNTTREVVGLQFETLNEWLKRYKWQPLRSLDRKMRHLAFASIPDGAKKLVS